MGGNAAYITKGIRILFWLGCAALPWIDLCPLSIYALGATGALLSISLPTLSLKPLKKPDPLTVVFFLFYALQLAGFLAYPGEQDNRFSLEQKASFVLVPVLLMLLYRRDPDVWVSGVKGFLTGLVAAGLYCLAQAFIRYAGQGQADGFFYHSLAGGIQANAIYFSLHLLTGLCLLIHYQQKKQLFRQAVPAIAVGSFFFLLILFLSSRILIVLSTVVLLSFFIRMISVPARRWGVTGGIIALVISVFLFQNPVRERYQQIELHSVGEVLRGESFKDYPFNGLDLRVFLLRLGKEVLQEDGRWMLGAGGRNYHEVLNRRMQGYQLFAGDSQTGDTGYLNYNLHNQYMENMIQYGIAGLLVLLLLLGLAIREGRRRSPVLLVLTLVYCVAFLTESVLETQSGVLLFTIFIYGEWKQARWSN